MAVTRNLVGGLVISLYFTGAALGQHREFAFGVGYAHLFWDGSNTGALEEQGGVRFDGRMSWPVTEPMAEGRPELRFGLGLGLSFYYSQRNGEIVEVGDVIIIDPDDYTQLVTIEPELQLSLRFPVGKELYLEPGVAGTFIVGNYSAGEEVFGFIDEDEDRWQVGGGGRLILRGAYHRDEWSVGIEGSYAYGWLDFDDDIGGDIQQGYLGFFYAHRF